jgi:hypothetical protein
MYINSPGYRNTKDRRRPQFWQAGTVQALDGLDCCLTTAVRPVLTAVVDCACRALLQRHRLEVKAPFGRPWSGKLWFRETMIDEVKLRLRKRHLPASQTACDHMLPLSPPARPPPATTASTLSPPRHHHTQANERPDAETPCRWTWAILYYWRQHSLWCCCCRISARCLRTQRGPPVSATHRNYWPVGMRGGFSHISY